MGMRQGITREATERTEKYRGYLIDGPQRTGPAYSYYHEEYDGPEDRRCGWAGSLKEAKEQIDERIDEGFDS